MTTQQENIFVTGGAGYIGSHACKALAAAGYTPITLDSLITGWREAVQYGPFEQIDLKEKEALKGVFEKYNPSAIFHFAALSLVGESSTNPALYWENNVLGSLNLIQCAVDSGCEHFVFSSTCATYGDLDDELLTEVSLQDPQNAYGASKLAVEQMIKNFGSTYDLKFVIFRYFNVAGADPAGEIGEFHQPETHLIPLVLDVALGKRSDVTIFGSDYDTKDGTCVRDYIHVCDLVDAHILGLEYLKRGGANQIFNLGTGEGFSVNEIITKVQDITKTEIRKNNAPRRPGDCARLVSGSELAQKVLGWKRKRSSLYTIISDAWHWQKKGGFTTD